MHGLWSSAGCMPRVFNKDVKDFNVAQAVEFSKVHV